MEPQGVALWKRSLESCPTFGSSLVNRSLWRAKTSRSISTWLLSLTCNSRCANQVLGIIVTLSSPFQTKSEIDLKTQTLRNGFANGFPFTQYSRKSLFSKSRVYLQKFKQIGRIRDALSHRKRWPVQYMSYLAFSQISWMVSPQWWCKLTKSFSLESSQSSLRVLWGTKRLVYYPRNRGIFQRSNAEFSLFPTKIDGAFSRSKW